MKIAVLLFTVISRLSIYSQTIKGCVTGSLSNDKLSYTNLVIKDTKTGVYTNEDGTFNLDISKTSKTDTLVVSLIGFHQLHIALTDYNSTNDYVLNIQLLPKVESLNEVLVLSKTKQYNKHETNLSTSKRKHKAKKR